jgi:hypothetical protein
MVCRSIAQRAGVLLVLSLSLICGSVRAQNLGSVQGVVTDPSGAAVPGATISFLDQATSATRTITSDSIGSYAISDLNPDKYTVTVTRPGFKQSVQQNVEVLVASSTTLNIHLEVGSVAEQITVKAESAPLLNTADATTGNPFNERQVEDLPFLARNVVDLLSLQPGVVFTGESNTDTLALGSTSNMDNREGAVNGVRGNQSNITVDGVDSNNWANQGAFSSVLPLTLDSVAEVRVITANANATDGTSSGGQVALVTKSGTNEFHGNVRWYYRTTGFTSNSYFNNLNGIPRPGLLRNIGGGSLGGPAVKNRVFFFLDNEERRDSSQTTTGPQIIPTDSLKDGVLIYACATPADCPGGSVMGMTGNHVVPAGDFGLTPADIKAIDPAGLGINPAMVSYMNLFPSGNVPSAGLDGGLSYTGFRFNAPSDYASNTYIARIDFNLTQDGKQTLFWRGNLIGASDTLAGAQFPGQPASQTLLNNSRGMVLQYQAQLSPTLTNTLRWGFTRAGIAESGVSGAGFGVRDYSSIVNFGARPNSTRIPVNEINDSVGWLHGKHSFSFGGLVRFVQGAQTTAASSFPSFSINPGVCLNQCADAYTNVSSLLDDPTPVSSQLFTEPYMMLVGAITGGSTTIFSDPRKQVFLPPGTIEQRTYDERNYEAYAQDSWHVRPTVTVTLGLRYQFETPPWEIHGFETAPTINLDAWFNQRVANMNQGIPSNVSPLLSWGLAGNANGKASWYNPDHKNFAPRLAIAWSPGFEEGALGKFFGGPGKSSIRAGFGVYYDRIGVPIAIDETNEGSPGASTALSNISGPYSLGTAPRFSGSCNNIGCSGLPNINQFVTIPTSAALPYTPPSNFQNFAFFVDPNLRTPYTMGTTLSFQRELPKKMSLEVAYIGTLGRRLLAKADYAQYLDLKDPQSGMTVFQAQQGVAKLIGPNYSNPPVSPTNIAGLSTLPPIAFFQNMMPNLPEVLALGTGNPGYATLTPTQAYYAFQLLEVPSGPSWACGIVLADRLPSYGLPSVWNSTVDPHGQGNVLASPQFTSLGGWTNWGNSNYNSLQVSIHKNVGPAIFTGSYVWSKSLDNDSSAQNGDLGGDYGTLVGLIQNAFDPSLNRGLSDFDVRQSLTGNWVVRLPFGRGERYASEAGRGLNTLIGGWEVTGLVRFRTGFPLSVGNGPNYATNWQHDGSGTLIEPVSTHIVRNGPGGTPNLFSDPTAVLDDDFAFTLPGENGSRNTLRGPAYVSTDMGVFKTFTMPWGGDRQRLQFRLTAFNVFNQVNFSAGAPWFPGNVSGFNGISLNPTSPATFGQITSTVGPRGGAREMETAIRYEF